MAFERKKFVELMTGDQSKAQRYAFFAEREASKVAGVPADTKPRKVENVAIIGAGTMGGGISMSFANAGIPVTIIEMGQEQLDRGLGVMKKNWDATAARGGMKPEDVTKRMGLITGQVGLEAAKDADLIIEAVFETMAIKKEVFGKLDAIAKPGAILASNTSYLNIDEIASATKRPQDVLGMHFFSPANVMKLCEIVRGAKTAPDVLVTAVAIARRIAKMPAVVGNCDGFVGNRMLAARGKQSDKLLYEGALPQQIDAVVTKFGIPMGPFTMSDMAGLDIGWRSRKDRGIKSEIPDALCEAGRFGLKTGKGYYKYEGGRAPIPDPEVEDLIAKTLAKMGKKPRTVSDDEILERMVYPMVNEGARILEEKIAARAERHRRGLALRLRLAGLSRRPDALCRQRRPEEGRRAAGVLREGNRRCLAGAGAASEEARRRGQDLRIARRCLKYDEFGSCSRTLLQSRCRPCVRRDDAVSDSRLT